MAERYECGQNVPCGSSSLRVCRQRPRLYAMSDPQPAVNASQTRDTIVLVATSRRAQPTPRHREQVVNQRQTGRGLNIDVTKSSVESFLGRAWYCSGL